MRPRERAEPTAAEDGVSGRNRPPTRARGSECERDSWTDERRWRAPGPAVNRRPAQGNALL